MATGGSSVNVPVNQAIKEKDVNSKLQLYGIYAAFANGKVPSVSAHVVIMRLPNADELCRTSRLTWR